MGELPLAAETGDLSREQPAGTGRQLFLAPVLPAIAEERQRQLAAAVGDDRLADAAAAIAHRPGGDGGDLSLDSYVFAVLEPEQVGQLTPLVVAPRVVAEQVAQGVNVQVVGEPLC